MCLVHPYFLCKIQLRHHLLEEASLGLLKFIPLLCDLIAFLSLKIQSLLYFV